jgi:hypothetical protein
LLERNSWMTYSISLVETGEGVTWYRVSLALSVKIVGCYSLP